MPAATSFTSAPSASQILAISLMKEILVARKALDAYLIISAVRRSVTTIGARSERCRSATLWAASLSSEPSTMRDGFMKSWMAEPSRRNSGQETTLNGIGWVCLARTMSATQSPVPTGTVDLLTMIRGLVMASAMDSAAARTYCRSASPSTPSGVPTAMKAKSAFSRASW